MNNRTTVQDQRVLALKVRDLEQLIDDRYAALQVKHQALGKRVDALTKKVNDLPDLTGMERRLQDLIRTQTKANTVAESLLTESNVAKIIAQARELSDMYEEHVSMLSTVESVLWALWRTAPMNREIPLESASMRLIQLMSNGSSYFHDRKDWTLKKWIGFLKKGWSEDLQPETPIVL